MLRLRAVSFGASASRCVVGSDAIGKKRDVELVQRSTQALTAFGANDAKTEQQLAIMAAVRKVVETSGLKLAVCSWHNGT